MINFIFGLIVGLLIGGVVGVGVMCILQVSRECEEERRI